MEEHWAWCPNQYFSSDLPVYSSLGNGTLYSPSEQPQPSRYAVIDLGTLGAFSYAQAINTKGQVVGYTAFNGNTVSHAFVYANGFMQDLGTVGGGASLAFGINDSGQVVGYSSPVMGHYRAFLYSGGSMQNISASSASNYLAFGININGLITGYLSPRNGNYPHAFLYDGSMHDLGTLGGTSSTGRGINKDGSITGDAFTGSGVDHAFLYANGLMQDIGTLRADSYGYGINDYGNIVGYSSPGSGVYHAFLYSAGTMRDIGTSVGGSSYGYSINNKGQVVGKFYPSGTQLAFIYTGGTMYDLNTQAINPTGWRLQSAQAINDAGQIAGYGISPSGQAHAFLLNPLQNGAIQAASTVQTKLPTYTHPASPLPAITGLVFITHGWISGFDDVTQLANAEAFVNSTSNAIVQYLAAKGIENWQVEGYMWPGGADQYLPSTALANAEQIGVAIGNYIVAQGNHGWTNIHFIAHSAGAGMIQKATEVIKTSLGEGVTVHCTFLDAYDGVAGEKALEYGSQADWADSYFVRDGLQLSGVTGRLLPNAYNTDVTALDPGSLPEPWYESLLDPGSGCFDLESSHGWPIAFYDKTIANDPLVYEWQFYNGFGFPLSEESGMPMGRAKSQYPPGNGVSYGSAMDLGPQNGNCTPATRPPRSLTPSRRSGCFSQIRNGPRRSFP